MEAATSRANWTLPEWMEPYRDLIEMDLGGNSIEELMRDETTNGFNNAIRSAMICMGEAKVRLLAGLKEAGALPDSGRDDG